LKKEVEGRLSKWLDGRILRPEEADPHIDELVRFEKNPCWDLIKKARYANLLWKMRNFAIHEFRPPGKAWAISDDNSTPYYHGVTTLPEMVDSWGIHGSYISLQK
jgi:hypothetical protein